jgi:hypothetical protein
MSTSAAHHPSVRTPSRLLAYASFAIMVGGWVAFAVLPSKWLPHPRPSSGTVQTLRLSATNTS